MVTPHDLDAEAQVLGRALVTLPDRELVLTSLGAEDFHDVRHQAIFRAITSLYSRGEEVTPRTVVLEVSTPGVSKEYTTRLLAEADAGGLRVMIERVADCAARRRAIGLADKLRASAQDMASDLGDTIGTLERSMSTIRLPGASFTPARDVRDFAEIPDEYDWIVPGLLERGDRLILVAGEGVGKSEALRQWSIMFAAGIHPFQRCDMRRSKVLLIDLENADRQIGRSARDLLRLTADRYAGGLHIAPRLEGINLRNPRDVQWIDRLCEHHKPDVVVVGPLYKAIQVGKGEKVTDETPAAEAAFSLDRLRARHGFALLIEAHAPHGDQGDRAGLRPYGASLWMRWPEFGMSMKPIPGEKAVDLKHWRGPRDRKRTWPAKLFQGPEGGWKWIA